MGGYLGTPKEKVSLKISWVGFTCCGCSESDKACQPCIRLAAAKSVLRLSRKWDFHISPEIFRLTISMAKVGHFVYALNSYGSWNRNFHCHSLFALSKFVLEKAILLVNLLMHQLRLNQTRWAAPAPYTIYPSIDSWLLRYISWIIILVILVVNSFLLTHFRMTLLWLEDYFWIKHTNCWRGMLYLADTHVLLQWPPQIASRISKMMYATSDLSIMSLL